MKDYTKEVDKLLEPLREFFHARDFIDFPKLACKRIVTFPFLEEQYLFAEYLEYERRKEVDKIIKAILP